MGLDACIPGAKVRWYFSYRDENILRMLSFRGNISPNQY